MTSTQRLVAPSSRPEFIRSDSSRGSSSASDHQARFYISGGGAEGKKHYTLQWNILPTLVSITLFSDLLITETTNTALHTSSFKPYPVFFSIPICIRNNTLILHIKSTIAPILGTRDSLQARLDSPMGHIPQHEPLAPHGNALDRTSPDETKMGPVNRSIGLCAEGRESEKADIRFHNRGALQSDPRGKHKTTLLSLPTSRSDGKSHFISVCSGLFFASAVQEVVVSNSNIVPVRGLPLMFCSIQPISMASSSQAVVHNIEPPWIGMLSVTKDTSAKHTGTWLSEAELLTLAQQSSGLASLGTAEVDNVKKAKTTRGSSLPRESPKIQSALDTIWAENQGGFPRWEGKVNKTRGHALRQQVRRLVGSSNVRKPDIEAAMRTKPEWQEWHHISPICLYVHYSLKFITIWVWSTGNLWIVFRRGLFVEVGRILIFRGE
ncbi:hypothetical protein B0H14DRAFT_3689899 [Mycena olivaceomarginata]|nr:hypothetical protein B0H14DRAFT_3689899 [Mycena olivaceomarginata]